MQDSSMYRQWQSSHIGGSNAAYVDELYESYLTDPNSVPEDWRAYFEKLPSNGAVESDVPHSAVREYFLLEAKNKWTSGAQTRRANRLEDRVFGQLWEQNRRGRTPGIYTILDRWTTVGAVAATSNDHARQLAEVMYGSIIEKDNVRVGRHGDITEDNLLEAINACEISPAYLEEKKERLKAKYLSDLAELEAKAEKGQYAQLLGLQALEELTEQSAE